MPSDGFNTASANVSIASTTVSFDVMADLGFPLATSAVALLLGVPEADVSRLKSWTRDVLAVVSAGQPTRESAAATFRGVTALIDYFRRRDSLESGAPLPWPAIDAQDAAGFAAVALIDGYEAVAYQIGTPCSACSSIRMKCARCEVGRICWHQQLKGSSDSTPPCCS